MPSSPARRRASSSSLAGYVSESAVTRTALSPSASLAARARNVESTPPENATTTRSIDLRVSTSRSYLEVASGIGLRLQSDEVVERPIPRLHLGGREPREPVQGEVFDGERGHDRAIHHRAPHDVAADVALPCEITHEAAGERVASTGRIED